MSYFKLAAIVVVFLAWIIGGAVIFCQSPLIPEEVKNKTTSISTEHQHLHTEFEADSWMPYHFDDNKKSPFY